MDAPSPWIRWRHWIARALLLAGLLAAGMHLFRHAPRKQALVFQLAQPEPVSSIAVSCRTEAGAPLRQFTLYRKPSRVDSIRHQLELPSGRYRMAIEVFFGEPAPGAGDPPGASDEPTASMPSRRLDRLVTLDGREKVILL